VSTNEAPSPESTPAEPASAPAAPAVTGPSGAVDEQAEAAPEAKRPTRARSTGTRSTTAKAASAKTAEPKAEAPKAATTKATTAKSAPTAPAAEAESTEAAPAKAPARTTKKAAAPAPTQESSPSEPAPTASAVAAVADPELASSTPAPATAAPEAPEPAVTAPAAPTPAVSTPPAQDRPSATSTGRRVVVAEDEALIRLDVVETLTEAGFNVVGEAGDGERAVALATELKPDVVVMDIKMPVMDGITAAERIGKARIAPVVLLTAFSQAELVERARDAGAMAYVVKPFTPAELLPAIEIAIARHQQITALEAEVADLAERFETRKRVERAKGLLMTKMGLSEPEAFRWIQKTSMDRRLTMREVADAVIDQVGQGEKTR